MPVSIRIPKNLTDTLYPNTDFSSLNDDAITHIKRCAKQLIERAITESLEPASVRLENENDFVGHLTINILNRYNRAIIKHSRQNQSAEAVVALGYLMTALNHDWHMSMVEAKETGLTSYLSALNYQPRHEQNMFYHFIDDALSQRKIGMVEASTGVGKSLAILAQANERAIHDNKLCAISTNSLANVQQYLSDYHQLIEHNISMVPLHLIIGRQNFVSSERLNAWLSSDNQEIDVNVEKIEAWLAKGGRTDNDPDFMPSMTMTSLKSVEPNVIDSEVSLSLHVSENDAGYIVYHRQFSEAMKASHGILLVTHTMLCLDVKFRRMRHGLTGDALDDLNSMQRELKGLYEKYQHAVDEDAKNAAFERYIELSKTATEFKMSSMEETASSLLPNYQYLFVDEAHLLENAMSNVTSETISLRSLLRDANASAESGLITPRRIKECRIVLDELMEHQKGNNVTQLMLSRQSETENHLLLKFCNILLDARVKRTEATDIWRNQAKQLKLGLNRVGHSNFTSLLSFSPVRRYPQVNTGEMNTLSYFRDMWTRTEGVAIISATLYIKRYNAYSANYIANILGITNDRRAEYPPVVAQWTRNIVKTVYMPPAERIESDKLIPIGRGFRGTSEERTAAKTMWERTQASYIEDIYNNAEGGTLTLFTAFEDCKQVANHIHSLNPSIPIVLADGDTNLEAQKAQFVSLSKAGKKPLWLTLGNAWVGLDVNGKSIGLNPDEIYEKDNVITDLIIVKIPFGTNMSLSYLLRTLKMQHKTSDIELMETIIRLKQGLGRLVRLEHQRPNRHIHLLDGRLNHPRYKGYLSLVKALVDTYPNTEHRTAITK